MVYERDIGIIAVVGRRSSLVPGVQEFLYANNLAEAVRLLVPVDHGSVLDGFADC
jgi:hypothetical protein